MTDKDLLRLIKEIEDKKIEIAEKKGGISTLNQRLLDEFGCANLEEALYKITTLEVSIKESKQILEDKLIKLNKRWEILNN